MNKIFDLLAPGNDDYIQYSERCNAIDILRASAEEHIQSNCLMYSVVLSEALLAYGIKSKVVICKPYDFYFNADCHCMVHAYIDEYRKWILFDPAYNSVYRCKGRFLSLQELRKCIISGSNIVIFGLDKKTDDIKSMIESLSQYLVVFFCLEYNGFNCHSKVYDNNINILFPKRYEILPVFSTEYNNTEISFYDDGFWMM